MNGLIELVAAVGSSIAIAAIDPPPVAQRTFANTITVTGADYASILPFEESIEIVDGTTLINGAVWGETIIYRVDPYTEYTITVVTIDRSGFPETVDFPKTTYTFTLASTPSDQLDWAVYTKIVAEREIAKIMNNHGMDVFDIFASINRCNQYIESTENSLR